jgi:hypothetical protein
VDVSGPGTLTVPAAGTFGVTVVNRGARLRGSIQLQTLSAAMTRAASEPRAERNGVARG